MGDSRANSTNSGMNFNDPYYLANGDHPGMQLGSHVLTGANFINWSRTVKMALIARNKLGFVDGSTPMPDSDSLDYQKWLRNDYMIMSWLLNSMDKNLSESFLFVNSSAQLWNELKEKFGHSNLPQLFDFHRSLTYIQQNDASIAEYFGNLKKEFGINFRFLKVFLIVVVVL
ncbi:uncharacterized protein LOC110703118 [Chenopodium quinoa]|uniref:uncharacterized protein LOC110703118 n=1 Tax=Chenopodium quinoa TaxID=63459 RepID=UPI000B79860A|nr:uncharacterized protein LOC110703118 [Chenopodium quinoa]